MKQFSKKEFAVFQIEGLEPRMEQIRAIIQPIFQETWEDFVPKISQLINEQLFIHIAQHRRRTTHAPENTWSAISTSKRGYKSEPHFQIGIWEDYVFIYLSMIDQPKNEREIAAALLENMRKLQGLSEDFVYSTDHTQKEYFSIGEDMETGIIRFRDVKKGEFEIGRVIPRDSTLWKSKKASRQYMWETIEQLLPIYVELLKASKVG